MNVDNKVEEVDVEEVDVVKSSPQGEIEHREQVVENTGIARRQKVNRVGRFIWLVFSILEVLLGLRFFLKLIAANPTNLFAQMVYNFTDLFMRPFMGLTNSPSAGGMVLEFSALIAMVVYALIAWALVSVIEILFNRSSARSVTVYERRRV